MIEVVSAVIIQEGRMLLTQRRPSQEYAWCWESPGGKVENGETHHEALRRELREELGIELGGIESQAFALEQFERAGRPNLLVSLYRTNLALNATPIPREKQGIGWFTWTEVTSLTMAPANERVRWKLTEYIRSTEDVQWSVRG